MTDRGEEEWQRKKFVWRVGGQILDIRAQLPLRSCSGQKLLLPDACEILNELRDTAKTAADMKFQALFFLLLLTCTCLSLAQGSYGNCCLGYVSSLKPRARRNIESYRMQETDGDCNIRAVVFQMRRRKTQSRPVTLCANPNKQWVKDLLKDLDRRKRA